jgi:hypothetical protein
LPPHVTPHAPQFVGSLSGFTQTPSQQSLPCPHAGTHGLEASAPLEDPLDDPLEDPLDDPLEDPLDDPLEDPLDDDAPLLEDAPPPSSGIVVVVPPHRASSRAHGNRQRAASACFRMERLLSRHLTDGRRPLLGSRNRAPTARHTHTSTCGHGNRRRALLL